MRYAVLIASAALLTLPGAGFGQEDDAMAQITAGTEAWEAGWKAGDAAAIAALYADGATLMPPGADPVTGQAAIQAFWQAALDSADGMTSSLETKEVQSYGDMAVEIGSYVDTAADGSHAGHGKWVAVWQKVDGSWKIIRDIWNSSM